MAEDFEAVDPEEVEAYRTRPHWTEEHPLSDEEQARSLGMPVEVMLARRERIQIEPFPQFGHAGRHNGNGSEDCPRWLHHHHDWYCQPPTPMEWALAGRTGEVTTGSRER